MTTNTQALAQTPDHNAMEAQPKWQDWSILTLAGILFISPWIFGTTTQILSSWNAWIVGIAFIPLTGRIFAPPPGEYANQCAH